jgi:serine/threonine protein phosphatase PrpC
MKAVITAHNLAADAKAGSADACAAECWQETILAVLADGVGDARFAQEAARRAVDSTIANLKCRPKSWSPDRALEEFTRLANRTLYQESLARCERPEMLCTLAAAVIEGGRLHGVNVGDSRVYLWHAGQLRQLSEDHAETEAGFRHVLRRALGLEADVQPYAFQVPISAGDIVLLCSDGLSNLLPPDQLAALLKNHASARTLVLAARELATERTLDDASAVVVEITGTEDLRPEALEVPGALRAGQVFDGCELVRPLNPAARAWIARREGRELVLKFAPERARDDEAVRNQFAREIWSVTRFEADYFIHAFVPPDNRIFCYCMDYVPAPTLKTVLEPGPLGVPDAVALAIFLLEAAQFFASRDLVHGDLKPENILVLPQARFKLIDFGSVTEIFSLTSRAGTPSFLAPERFQQAPISERTEIFAIGVTLFLALTGRYPYGEIEPFQTPVFRAPRRPTQLNPHLPAWLEAVALRAVAAAPRDRYQSYSEMKFDLQNPGQVRPWFGQGTPLLERNPLLFYKCGFFLLALVVLVLLCLLMNRR